MDAKIRRVENACVFRHLQNPPNLRGFSSLLQNSVERCSRFCGTKWDMPRGGKPKPVQQQIAEGDPSKRGVHRLDRMLAAMPKAMRGLGDPPSHLTGLAREQWLIWKQVLERFEQDYHADRVMLEGAAVHYERAIQADEILKDGTQIEEVTYDRITGQASTRMKKHPAVAVSNQSWKLVRAFCSELALSLAARRRMAIEPSESGATDELMQLLLKPRARKSGDGIQ